MTAFFANTHTGLKRRQNEDCYLTEPALDLYLVADGVGGHADGEVASAIVRDTLQHHVSDGTDLIASIHHAHHALLEEISRRQQSNMGSTVVVALLKDNEYDIAWVGDSRAYSYNGELKQLTRDHNPVSEMLASGAITSEQAASHPQRNLLSQSLGVSESIVVTPGRLQGKLEPGQQLLLCSDGLNDELRDSSIARIMAREATPEAQVKALISAALDAGGRDNVTVIVLGEKAPSGGETVASDGSDIHPAPNSRVIEATKGSGPRILLGTIVILAIAWAAMKALL